MAAGVKKPESGRGRLGGRVEAVVDERDEDDEDDERDALMAVRVKFIKDAALVYSSQRSYHENASVTWPRVLSDSVLPIATAQTAAKEPDQVGRWSEPTGSRLSYKGIHPLHACLLIVLANRPR